MNQMQYMVPQDQQFMPMDFNPNGFFSVAPQKGMQNMAAMMMPPMMMPGMPQMPQVPGMVMPNFVPVVMPNFPQQQIAPIHAEKKDGEKSKEAETPEDSATKEPEKEVVSGSPTPARSEDSKDS